MYTPTNCKSLAETTNIPQIRLLVQGYPGTGKTWAALTFPNPVVLNLDRGLGAHTGRKDVIEVPFYDDAFVRSWSKDMSYKSSGLKDALIKWLEQEATKLTAEQTLVIDGNTGIQNAYHKWFQVNQARFLTKTGQVNDFAEWTVKKQYYGEIMEIFKTLKCHVVYICHEVDLKDKNGITGPTYSGKIRPLLTGAFGDELASHFTDCFRAHSASVPVDAPKSDVVAKDWNMSVSDYTKWLSSFRQGTMYYWQTMSDNVFDAKASSLVNFPRYIPADFRSFETYRRK